MRTPLSAPLFVTVHLYSLPPTAQAQHSRAAEGSSLAVQGALEVLQSSLLPSTDESWKSFLLELSCRVRKGLEEVALETGGNP